MKASILARKIHKWFALLVGIQALFWMLSGAYMATINIDFIHGDSLVRNLDDSLATDSSGLYSITKILGRFPGAVSVNLESRNAAPYFVVRSANETALLDGRTGAPVPALSRNQAIALAKHYYAGDGDIGDVVYLSDDEAIPGEIRSRPLPLWQVTFSDGINTTFYLSPSTGKLLVRRHSFWRLYDFLWMFHIMDYQDRSDINNNLLRFAAMFGLAMALSGLWLLVHSLRGRQLSSATVMSNADQTGRSYGSFPKTS